MKITYRTARSYFLFTCLFLTLGLTLAFESSAVAEKSQTVIVAKRMVVTNSTAMQQTNVSIAFSDQLSSSSSAKAESRDSSSSGEVTDNASPETSSKKNLVPGEKDIKGAALVSQDSKNSEINKKNAESVSDDNSADKHAAKTDKQTENTDKQATNTDKQTENTDKQATNTDKQTESADKQAANTDKQTESADKQAANTDKQNGTEEALTVPKPRRKKTPTFLGPNQKYNIAGFAEQSQPKVVDDNASTKPVFHRVQMRVTGSMCYACLLEFQEKLLQIYGIERARVAKSEQISVSAYSPAMANWADAILFYDASKIDLLDLRAYMRGSGYYPYKMVDKEVNEIPPTDQKHI